MTESLADQGKCICNAWAFFAMVRPWPWRNPACPVHGDKAAR